MRFGAGQALLAAAALLGVADAQGFFGSVTAELGACGSDNFVDLGCCKSTRFVGIDPPFQLGHGLFTPHLSRKGV